MEGMYKALPLCASAVLPLPGMPRVKAMSHGEEEKIRVKQSDTNMAVSIPHLSRLRFRLCFLRFFVLCGFCWSCCQIFLARFANMKPSSGLLVQCYDYATDRIAREELQSCVYECVGGWVTYVWLWNFPHMPLWRHSCQHELHALSAPASHQIPTESNWYICSKM